MEKQIEVTKDLLKGLLDKLRPTNFINKIKNSIMARIQPFRKGDTAEYLAQVFLSAIAFSNPIYRQEDYGIDFSCTLIDSVTETIGNRKIKKLFPNESFNIQVKTSNPYKVIYKNEFDNIKWLYKSKTPIFLAHLHVDKKRMDFFSLSPIHTISIKRNTNYENLILKYTPNPTKKNIDSPNAYDYVNVLNNYEVSLGKPFMTIDLKDLNNEDLILEKKKILKDVISIEQENITYRTLNLPVSRWLWKYETNKPNTFQFGWAHFCDEEWEKQINKPEEVLTHLGQFIITLAKSYELHKDDENNGEKYIKHHNNLRKIISDLPVEDKTLDGIKYQYKNYLEILKFRSTDGALLPDITKD